MKQKGFTLIELLVVIAIIAVLASVILISINGARVKARNNRRNADIKQLINAFHLALSNAPFPATGGTWYCLSPSCYGGYSGNPANVTVDAYVAPYISKPSDPEDSTRGMGGYLYKAEWPGGGASLYDGFIFGDGVYLNWAIEPPAEPTSCGVGRIWSANASVIQCLAKID